METEEGNMTEYARCDNCGATCPDGERCCSEECYREYQQGFEAKRQRMLDSQIDEARLHRAEFKFYVERVMAAIQAAKESK